MSQQYPNQPQDPNQSPWGAQPQGQTYGQPPAPYQPAPPQPPKRNWFGRHKILTIVGALVAVLIIGGIASGGSDDTGSDTSKTAPEKEADAKPAGDDAKDKPADEPKAKDKPKAAEPESKSYGDGDYVIGEDIPAGTYTSAGAKKGLFEMCVISTEGDGTLEHMAQLKSANADERIIITLAKADGVLTIAGCEDLKPRK